MRVPKRQEWIRKYRNVKIWVRGPFLLIKGEKRPILAKDLHIFLITKLLNKIHPMRLPEWLEWVKIWVWGFRFC